MAFDATADLDAMFSDFGVPVGYGTARTTGIPSVRTVEATDTEGFTVTKRVRVVTVASAWVAAQATLGDDSLVTVDGETRRVRSVQPEGDGALAVLLLADGSA